MAACTVSRSAATDEQELDRTTAAIRSLLVAGLTLRDVAERLGMHERAVAAVCLCGVTELERHEHPLCPRHVLEERARCARARQGAAR